MNHQFYSALHLVKLKRGKGWNCTYHKQDVMPVLIGKDGLDPELACPLCIAEEYGGHDSAELPFAKYIKSGDECEIDDCTQPAHYTCSVCGKRVCIIDCYENKPGTPCVNCGLAGLPEEDETNFPTVSAKEDAEGWVVTEVNRE